MFWKKREKIEEQATVMNGLYRGQMEFMFKRDSSGEYSMIIKEIWWEGKNSGCNSGYEIPARTIHNNVSAEEAERFAMNILHLLGKGGHDTGITYIDSI